MEMVAAATEEVTLCVPVRTTSSGFTSWIHTLLYFPLHVSLAGGFTSYIPAPCYRKSLHKIYSHIMLDTRLYPETV